MFFSRRSLYLIGFLVCVGLLAGALYFEHVLGLEPCPLCIFQRLFFIGIGILCLSAFIHNARGWGNQLYAGLGCLLAIGGGAVSARHVWLQHLPPELVPDCGPGLSYMFETFPLTRALEMVLAGSGECAEVSWRFLGLTMPAWTLIIFVCFAAAGLFQALRPVRH